MDKNTYQTIQDWYELFKSGIISESEFISKKIELLGTVDLSEPVDDKHTIIEEDLMVSYNYSDTEFTNNEDFISKYRLLIILSVVCVMFFGLYLYVNKNNNSDSYIGPYIVKASNRHLVHFHNEPDILTMRNAYFNSPDTIFVYKIENNFGYTEYVNDRQQKSIGWIKLDEIEYVGLK